MSLFWNILAGCGGGISSPVYVRGFGGWWLWPLGERDADDVPIVTGRQVGDLLLVYTLYSGATTTTPTNGGWTAIHDNGLGKLWARIATGDSNDAFTLGSATTSSQGGGGAQMIAVAGLDWAAAATKHQSANITGRRVSINYPAVADGTENDTLVVFMVSKVWYDGHQAIPTFSSEPGFPSGDSVETISGQTRVECGDRDIFMMWGIRYDEGSPVSIASEGDCSQVPLDDANHPTPPWQGSCYSSTLRLIES